MIVIDEDSSDSLNIAVKFLREKKLISFATDTVYGIACDASSEEAVDKIFKIKNRQANKPIAIFLNDLEQAKNFFDFNIYSDRIAKKFMPGPITLVLEVNNSAKNILAKNLNSIDNFIGFRIVNLSFISNLLKAFGRPLAVTSANLSQEPSSIRAIDVKKYFFDEDILLIDGGICKEKISSTVVKVDNNKVEIIRNGAIDKKNIYENI